MTGQPYEVFIAGESVDLCTPRDRLIDEDGWAEWFNDAKAMRFLEHGVFPNTREQQHKLLDSLNRHERLLLAIRPKNQETCIGVVSLSEINVAQRMANIAIVIGKEPKGRNLIALEAMALITEHGFEKMGLWRIGAGQTYPELAGWNKRMELIGYRAEGILRSKFVKGHVRKPGIALSCLYEDFLALKDVRGGKYWLGEERMFELVKAQPRDGFADILDKAITELGDDYFGKLKQV